MPKTGKQFIFFVILANRHVITVQNAKVLTLLYFCLAIERLSRIIAG